MRAAPFALLVLAAAAASAGAQVVVVQTPSAPQPPATPRMHMPQRFPTREWETKIRALGDSLGDAARQLKEARKRGDGEEHIGALEQRFDELRERMDGLQGELGPMQAQIEARASAAAEAAVAGQHVDVRERPRGRSPSELTRLIKRVSADPQGVKLPPSDSIADDDFQVAAGSTVGRVAAMGDLDVFGTVNGDAVALNGDVIVHKGGHVTGDALSVGGTVQLDGGTVDGELRSIDEAVVPSFGSTAANRGGFIRLLDELQVVMGWLVAMVLLGFASMVFAEERLRVVASTIESRFGRSLLFGVIAEVSCIPALVLSVVLLAITIIGIVLIPVAIPAVIVLTALLAVLGFLAVSRVAGQALTRHAAAVSVRGAELRSMLAGLFFFFGLWLAAAVLGWVPILGSLLHALAFVVTWAAATVGLGAAVISRGGARAHVAAVPPPSLSPDIGWQTPTPISGIAAARRPASTTPEL